MTALSLHAPGDAQRALASWGFSVLLHGLMIGSALVLMTDLRLSPQPEPFKWEVSMIEPARTAPAQPAPPQPVVENTPIEPQPVTQPVQTVQRVVHQEVRTVTPVVQRTPVPEPIVTRTAQAVEASRQEVEQPAETTVASVAQLAVQEPAASPPSSMRTTDPSAVRQLPVRTGPAPRRDFGWLAEDLWSRVEALKRYPQMARANQWQGKVVLKAVIKADGTVANVEVVESSGHAVLDDEALKVIREASPLTLRHDLGQPQVTVQIPINYALR